MQDTLNQVLRMAVVPAFILGFLVLILLLSRRQRRAMDAKLQSLANALEGELDSESYQINLRSPGKAESRVLLILGGKSSPDELLIEQMSPLGFDLAISQPNKMTQALEKIHLVKEVKTGDPIFDQKYAVHSRDPDQARNFLLNAARREAVDYFFGSGFSLISADREMVAAVKDDYDDSDLEPDLLRQHLEQLRKFVSG